MSFESLLKQMEVSKKSIEELKVINDAFDQTIEEAIKSTTGDNHAQVIGLRNFANQVIDLAKKGKQKEAQALINNYTHGS